MQRSLSPLGAALAAPPLRAQNTGPPGHSQTWLQIHGLTPHQPSACRNSQTPSSPAGGVAACRFRPAGLGSERYP